MPCQTTKNRMMKNAGAPRTIAAPKINPAIADFEPPLRDSAHAEIGGELRAAGANERGEPWRVAIERPAPGAAAAQRILLLTDAAIATSGDYRNFYHLAGARVSHTVDPRTGRPVTHGLRSVGVIAERCMLADARSTALNVLGPEDGYALAVEQGWAALFVTDDGTGRFVERETPAFTAAVR